MFEDMTYEALMKRALARVPPTMDKREGSMAWNGVAPSMAELAQLYMGMEFIFRASYLLTAPREYLIKRAADRNMAPYPASAAVYRAEMDRKVPAGTRFSCGEINFAVTSGAEGDGPLYSCHVTSETAGAAANHCAGNLVPIEYIDGLTTAVLRELLTPGDDAEETETFRQRVLDSFQSQAFGGNQADYREKVLAIPGVSAVKIYPAWNGGLQPASLIPNEETAAWYEASVGALEPAVATWLTDVYTAASQHLLTVGGTVRLVVMASGGTVPTEFLLETVQTRIDPVQNTGEGLGLAPIGHVVKVEGVRAQPVDITLHLTYAAGWDWEAAKEYVEASVDAYFAELAGQWAGSDGLTVRISQIESRILSGCAEMVADIGQTQLNGEESNLLLDGDSIPVRGKIYG